jgi:hypothetical protein
MWIWRAVVSSLVLLSAAHVTSAAPITLTYHVTVTERAHLAPIGNGYVDPISNLYLDSFQAYFAEFEMGMTFEFQPGLYGNDTTYYGKPSFGGISLPHAVSGVVDGTPGSEPTLDGQTFAAPSMRPDGGSVTNYGAYLNDSILIPNSVQSGSTTLMTDLVPQNFAGPWEFPRPISLADYLANMTGTVHFDFSTWTYFYQANIFSDDSYDYRGTATFVRDDEPTPVPEPTSRY